MRNYFNSLLGLAILFIFLLHGTLPSAQPLLASSDSSPGDVAAAAIERLGVSLKNIGQLVAGGNHACAVSRTGALFCWGDNRMGQLGDGSNTDQPLPMAVKTLNSNVKALAVGYKHTCALLLNGSLHCWGDNSSGQVGDRTKTNRNTPVAVLSVGNNVSAVTAGDAYTCALLLNGMIKCWGANTYGQLGDGTTSERNAPVDVIGLNNGGKLVVAGSGHTCALVNSGVVCWGYNEHGQLGDGTTQNRSTPTPVIGLNEGVAQIVTGRLHTCAVIASNGSIKCWGNNYHGQLGNGTTVLSTSAVDVINLSGVTGLTAGDYHTCAVAGGGTTWCWGNNRSGQLGDSAMDSRAAPVAVVGLTTSVGTLAAGAGYTCAVLTSSEVTCWGANPYGQQGVGTKGNRLTPDGVVEVGMDVDGLAVGHYHTCVVTNLGSVKCWGRNDDGQLGDGTRSNRMTPTDVVGLASGVRALAAGGYHTCALLITNSVKCWGRNDNGQLGDGTGSGRAQPVDVIGLSSGVVMIAAGIMHTCALMTTGSVKCWGNNTYGELGDNSLTWRRIPVDVVALTNGAEVFANGYHTCAIDLEGAAKCWGANAYAQLGDGTTTNRLLPTNVLTLTQNVTTMAAGGGHTCALQLGIVYCWGNNTYGQLGNGAGSRIFPDPVVGLSGTVTMLSASSNHTCAIVNDGAYCWGYNYSGAIGDGTTQNRPAPVQVSGLITGLHLINTGQLHTCALVNHAVQCWGDNEYGQLGNNNAWHTQPQPVLTAFCYSPT